MKLVEHPDYKTFEEKLAPLWVVQGKLEGMAPPVKRPWAFTLEDEHGQVVGGVGGFIRWEWMYIQHVLVVPELRGKGHGRDLMMRAEKLAKESSLLGMYLTTMTYQVPDFYRKLGFVDIGTIEDMPKGAGLVTLAKRL